MVNFIDTPQLSLPRRRRVLVALAWWEDRIVSGIARYAAEHDWILDCSLRLAPRLPEVSRWPADGAIVYTGAAYTHEPLAQLLRNTPGPKVCLHSDLNVLKAPAIGLDNAAVGQMAAEHLLSLHLEHFAFVEFDANPIEDTRRAAFERRVRAAGRPCRRIAFQDLADLLPQLPRPMGLMAANDINAMDVVSTCLAAGLRVPEDFAILGVDNSDVSSRISPVPLSSIACDYERLGYEAAALLDACMAGRNRATSTVVAPSGVVVRRSTDTISISDEDTARALRFLRDHFREPFRIKELGGLLQGRLRRVQAQFRSATGRTMSEELMRLRINHAKQLLADSKLKIESVAYQSGFASRFHLNHAFRRATGRTPTAFRHELLTRAASLEAEKRTASAAPSSTRRSRFHDLSLTPR